VVLWFLLVRRIEHTFNRAFARDSAPGREARMFEVAGRQAFQSDLLRSLQLRTSGAARALQKLQRLMELADIRFTTLVHFPLNALTLWDFHVLAAVERWQRAWGRHVRDWFIALGEFESLSALAGLYGDNPGWTLPTFGTEPLLEAASLGHPLLPERTRVANDVRVGPPGTFLFVTGSNMSGKSTLLRAIGINVVLAQAGGAVCAARMRLPAVQVATSMRVQDSLEAGVSYFLAALQRLKEILEAAGTRSPDGPVVLYLLDEILQGTNTAERQIAVRTVLTQLLETGAIGAVTSHDLNLADEEPLASAGVPVHFEEHFEGDTMTFDYHLRPGVATSRNALKLMKMIGIAAAAPARPDSAT
jgi:DNA mismatch repair ATPase MutS